MCSDVSVHGGERREVRGAVAGSDAARLTDCYHTWETPGGPGGWQTLCHSPGRQAILFSEKCVRIFSVVWREIFDVFEKFSL